MVEVRSGFWCVFVGSKKTQKLGKSSMAQQQISIAEPRASITCPSSSNAVYNFRINQITEANLRKVFAPVGTTQEGPHASPMRKIRQISNVSSGK